MKSKAPAPRSARGRPRKYTEEMLVDAALRVMGRDGYSALTTRALAEELGVTHSALYTYVGTIEEIEDKAVHRLTDELPLPTASSAAELRKELLAYVFAARRLLLLHPGVLISRSGSAASEIFREISDRWYSALLPFAPDMKTVQLALGALMGTVLLIVEGERLLKAGTDRKSQKIFDAFEKHELARYLDDLIVLVLPGLSDANKGRKPARSGSKK